MQLWQMGPNLRCGWGDKESAVSSPGGCWVREKVRMLYMVGQTRVHLDKVEGLGEFVELEVWSIIIQRCSAVDNVLLTV